MNVWVNLTCFTVLNNFTGITIEPRKFVFDYITLGHSGFLVTWNSDVTPNENCGRVNFRFGYRIKNAEDINFSFLEDYSDYTFHSDNQYKINSLEENTLYEVIIEIYSIPNNDESLPEAKFSMEMKTNWKTNTKPAKPDFEWVLMSAHWISVKWFPCGRDRNCHGKEAGSDFAVKLKQLDRREEWKRLMSAQATSELNFRHFLFGILYEMVVISIKGDFETNSDPQEIFLMPMISAITSTEVVSLSNASILLSWKPPKYAFVESIEYIVDIYYSFSHISTSPIYSSILDSENKTLYSNITNSTKILLDKRQYEWLKPGDTYTIMITPFGLMNEYSSGFSTAVEYTLPVDKDD